MNTVPGWGPFYYLAARSKRTLPLKHQHQTSMAIKRKRVLNQVFEVTPVSSNKKVKHVQPEKKLIKDEEDEVPLLVGSDEKPEALSEFSEGALHEELAAWSKLMVPTEVLRALKELNYTTPTAIQVAAIPVALRDRLDVLGAAETGSGKTLAFGIPLIHFITEEKRVDPIRKLRGLILTPTRELAVQIKRHIDQVAKYSDVTVSCVVGGLSVQKQERILRRSKPDIVVATPGRLWEMIESTNQEHLSKKSLRELKFLVIDEADRLTEKGHFEELTKVIEVMNNEEEDDIDENLEQLIDIKEVAYEDLDKWSDFGDDGVEEVSINGSDADEELSIASDDESEHSESDDEIHEVPKEDYDYGALKTSKTTIKRQILVFSATLTLIHDVPQRMKIETRKNKKRRQDFTVQGKLKQLMALVGMRPEASRVVDLTQNGSGRPNQEYLKEAVMMCAKEEKDMYLYYFLTLFPGRSIVFCNSKDCLRRLQNVLKILNMAPLTMHADMDQKHRLMALEKFTSVPGKGLLLASDVAARGLDISKVDHVLHYQCPRTAEGYVHRSGRTARAQTKGVTLIIVDPSEGYHYSKLCTSVNEGNHFASFPVEPSVFSVIKRRVELAQEIDIIDHRLKKTRSQSDWFKKAAREMDIDLEGRDDLFNHEREQPQTIANRKLLKGLQKQLNSLLKAPIGSHHRSTLEQLIKNPTASDELVSLVGNKTAIEAIEDVERKKPRKLDVARARPKKKEKKPRHVRKKPRN